MPRDIDTEVDGEFNKYMRRYLNDDINNIGEEEVHPKEIDTEVDSEFTTYIRHYLNDLSE